MSDRQWFGVAISIYGVSLFYSIFIWKGGFREGNRANYLLLFAAYLPHTIALISRGFSLQQCPVTNLFEATAFVLWTINSAYLVIGFWQPLRFLGAFASPLLFATGVFAMMPGLDSQSENELSNGAVSLHATLILLSYGAFGLSAIAGAMFLTQEHDLRFNKVRAIISLLPPIQRLDLTMARLLFAGLVLLTAGLATTPFIYPETHSAFQMDAKIIWSILVWSMYVCLFAARLKKGLQGKRLALGSVFAFAFVILTFWGTNLMSRTHQ